MSALAALGWFLMASGEPAELPELAVENPSPGVYVHYGQQAEMTPQNFGDIANLGDPKIHWEVPTHGGIIWTDNMIIPLGGSVPTASTYMNFMYDPKISAQWAVGANYISSVTGVKPGAEKLSCGRPDARVGPGTPAASPGGAVGCGGDSGVWASVMSGDSLPSPVLSETGMRT